MQVHMYEKVVIKLFLMLFLMKFLPYIYLSLGFQVTLHVVMILKHIFLIKLVSMRLDLSVCVYFMLDSVSL